MLMLKAERTVMRSMQHHLETRERAHLIISLNLTEVALSGIESLRLLLSALVSALVSVLFSGVLRFGTHF